MGGLIDRTGDILWDVIPISWVLIHGIRFGTTMVDISQKLSLLGPQMVKIQHLWEEFSKCLKACSANQGELANGVTDGVLLKKNHPACWRVELRELLLVEVVHVPSFLSFSIHTTHDNWAGQTSACRTLSDAEPLRGNDCLHFGHEKGAEG